MPTNAQKIRNTRISYSSGSFASIGELCVCGGGVIIGPPTSVIHFGSYYVLLDFNSGNQVGFL